MPKIRNHLRKRTSTGNESETKNRIIPLFFFLCFQISCAIPSSWSLFVNASCSYELVFHHRSLSFSLSLHLCGGCRSCGCCCRCCSSLTFSSAHLLTFLIIDVVALYHSTFIFIFLQNRKEFYFFCNDELFPFGVYTSQGQ